MECWGGHLGHTYGALREHSFLLAALVPVLQLRPLDSSQPPRQDDLQQGSSLRPPGVTTTMHKQGNPQHLTECTAN
eukprot:1908164-Amphidinium_carterae.3